MAATAIREVVGAGRSLSTCLAPLLAGLRDGRDRALARECTYGVLRWFHRLDEQLNDLIRRPLRERDTDVRMLLLVGLYQIQHLDIPAHAAVAATVDACAALGKPWAKALVNAVLRSALRDPARLAAAATASDCARWSHPAWLIERLRRDWPEQCASILEANNARAPLTLRVNRRRVTRDAYLAVLEAAGMPAQATRFAADGVRLSAPVAVDALPGFTDGLVSVQDEAAQLAADLLDPPAHARVLDGCAAPGGKTAHLLERGAEGVEVTAVDHDADRLVDLRENLARLRLDCLTVCADVSAPESWWDGRGYDCILLDVPCSAIGVVRRNPDIKILRRSSDPEQLAARQRTMLAAVWPLLNPGGKLVYSTCTLMAIENDGTIADFLAHTPDAECPPIAAGWGQATLYGRQIFPGADGMDGFYYAGVVKPRSGREES